MGGSSLGEGCTHLSREQLGLQAEIFLQDFVSLEVSEGNLLYWISLFVVCNMFQELGYSILFVFQNLQFCALNMILWPKVRGYSLLGIRYYSGILHTYTVYCYINLN